MKSSLTTTKVKTTVSLMFLFSLQMLAVLAVASSIALAVSDNQTVAVNVLDNTTNRTVLEYKLGDFVQRQAQINDQIFTEVHLGKESLKSEKGMPALPNVSRSIIIPDDADMAVRVLSSSYYEIQNIDISPSKGTILRTVNPADVPYTFDKQYKTNAFYPGLLAELRQPYILRDQRGIVVTVNPFQYNPVRHILRVYTSITVEVAETTKSKINVLKRIGNKHSHTFGSIYKSRFLNYDAAASATRDAAVMSGPMTDTEGNMLIICNDAWLPNIQPLVDHKNAIGINTTAIGISTIGNTSTAIKNYIQNVYNTSNLAFVLLVGDAVQVATPTASGGSSDPTYSKLAGSDDYPDIIVGRFSAETAADVDIQVLKTIEYETMPATQQDWFWRGVGIASPEGNATTGDDAESDQQHIEGLRVALLAYDYTLVDQIYEALGPTAADVTNALNAGRSVINYCGHGSITAWGTTGFSVTNVNALTNYNMLPFIFDVACVNGQFNGYTCFAEAWMRATSGGEPTGAAGIYASSINQSWAPPMEAQDKFNSLYIAGTYSAYGALCYNASCSMMDKYSTDGINMFNTWHIFGDPSLRIVGSAVVDNNIAKNPSPADNAVNVNTNTALGWTSGISAASHDVYFGIDYNSVLDANHLSSVYKGNQPLGNNSYNPGILNNNTTYYWAIDEINDVNIWPGNVWKFTTIPLPPGQAANPNPANAAANVGVNTDLSWTAGSGAASHNVYFGTVNPPPLVSSSQTAATYDTGTMAGSTTYYWRIDEKNAGGTTTGTVWSFTTVIVIPTPTFVASGTAVSGTGNITVAWPTHVAGDVALLFVESCGGQAATLSTPAGFAAVTNSPQATGTTTNGTRITVFWCRATSSAMTSPVVGDPGDHAYGRILTFRNVISTGNPWDVTAGGVKATASTTSTFGTVTTTVNNELIVLAASRSNDSTSAAWSAWTNANLSSITERQDGGTTSGNGGGIGVATGIKATAGVVGSSTATTTSSVDGHMTIALKPVPLPAAPGAATTPNPANAATSVSLTSTLSWTAGSGATSHDVYFGTASTPPLIGNQTGTSYNPGTLLANRTYYWRIDEKNTGGTTTGAVWSFTTIPPPPGAAAVPSPADGATNISVTQDISWMAGAGAASHDVYFGTVNPPPSMGNQTGTTYDTGTMANNKTYYWRINEKNAGGTTTGAVWSFTTIAKRTLTSSSTTGGDVTTPGEGAFQYDHGTATNITATVDAGYLFVNWTGSGVTAGKVADPNSASTTITMDSDYTVVANFVIGQYAISASAGVNGSIDPVGDMTKDYGSSQLFTATADPIYEVDKWTVDGVDVQTGGTTYTLSNISAAHTVAVSFKMMTYTVSASAGNGGSIDPAGNIIKDYDSSQLFTATVNPGHEIGKWTVDGVDVQTGGTTYTLNNITAAHTITVSFNIFTYTVSASTGDNGSIDPIGDTTKDYGSSQLFTAAPNLGYTVDKWTVDGIDVQTGGTTYTLSDITAAHTVAVSFKMLTYTVSASAGADGSIDPVGDMTKDYGTSQLFTAAANPFYEVDKWTVDGVDVQTGGTTYTLSNITASHTVAVSFKIFTYTVSASAGNGGSIDPAGDIVKDYDSSQLFTATVNLGYEVDKWIVDGVDVQTGGNTYTLSNITVAHTVAVDFKIFTYTVSASAGANGSIDPVGDMTKDYGTSQLFTATADPIYEVDKWTVDGIEVQTGGTTYTLSNITAAHTVAVSFKMLSYTVSASAGNGGSIDPAGDITKDYGSSQLFTATINPGYEIDKWTVDGVDVQTGGTAYMLSDITAAHTVAVSFRIFTYTVSASAGANGGINPVGDITKDYGSSQLFTATANPGYMVYKWSVDSIEVQTSGTTYTLSNITAAHTVAVTFIANPPGAATIPSPANAATGVSLTPTLSWTAGSGATSRDVYFGTASTPPLVSSSQTGTTYAPGTLVASRTYYWRIDEKNASGTTTGTVWSFTTVPAAPGAATVPSPANAATGVSLTPTLSWTAGSGATSRDVYFGTASTPPLVSSSQTGTTYAPGTLVASRTYYWRINEKNAGGTTTGTVWSFTTQSVSVGIIGSWVTGTTHAKETGTNRSLIFIAHGELASAAMNLSAVTYGGQAMTKVVERNYNVASSNAYVVSYILKEAGVAAATNTNFVLTWTGTAPAAVGYSSAFFSNVNQTTSVGATGTGASITNPVTTSAALATTSGDMVILGATCGNAGTYTLNNSFTEGTDQQMSSTATGVTGHKSATGANETPSATYSSTINRQTIIGLVVKHL